MLLKLVKYMNSTPKMAVFGGFWWFFLGTFLGGPIYSIRSTRVEFPKLWRAFFTLDMLIKPVKYMNLGPKSAIFGGFRWFFWVRFQTDQDTASGVPWLDSPSSCANFEPPT